MMIISIFKNEDGGQGGLSDSEILAKSDLSTFPINNVLSSRRPNLARTIASFFDTKLSELGIDLKMDDILQSIGIGQRSPHDQYFDDSYKTCKISVRKGVTIVDEEELCHEAMKEFPCNVPGCSATFNTLVDFEIHYNGSHRYICLECKKSRPSSRLLDIHIQETHDNFFKVLAQRQPMHQCYVPECDMKFKTPIERREHCITVHKYPKNFRFDEGTRRRDKGDLGNRMEVEKETQLPKTKKSAPCLNKNQRNRTFCPVAVDKKTGSENSTATIVSSSLQNPKPVHQTSSLSFIPRQVTSYSKLLTKNQNSEREVLNSGCMMDLAESLPG